jgi:hypothetical protein
MNWLVLILFIICIGFVVWIVLSARKECAAMNSKKK